MTVVETNRDDVNVHDIFITCKFVQYNTHRIELGIEICNYTRFS